MKLLDFRQAVISHIQTSAPTLTSVKSHGGIFSRTELIAQATTTPAGFVAILGIPELRRNNAGQLIGPASCSTYVVTSGANALDDATDLVETLAAAIDTQQFGLTNVAAAVVDSIDILHLDENDGIAVAAVGWTQEVTFGIDRHQEDEALDQWDIEGGDWPDNFGVRENETGPYIEGDKEEE